MREMALNTHENDGLERLWEEWLWRLVALDIFGRNGFEGLWLWMPMKEMTLNVYENGGSERQWEKWP